MTDDGAKRAILARRARFIAAAVTGAGLSLGACREAGPEVCLSAVPVDEKNKGTGTPPADAGAVDSGADTGEGWDAPPMPCLSPAVCLSESPMPTKPTVCLKPAMPRDAGKP